MNVSQQYDKLRAQIEYPEAWKPHRDAVRRLHWFRTGERHLSDQLIARTFEIDREQRQNGCPDENVAGFLLSLFPRQRFAPEEELEELVERLLWQLVAVNLEVDDAAADGGWLQ